MPETVDDAVRLLGQGGSCRCLAGGGLVVPGLREGDRPAGLVSLKRLTALKGIARQPDGEIWVGAMTPHGWVASAVELTGGNTLVRQAAGQIAHPVIRNMATIGGTLCAANPSADYCCALLAAGAHIHLRSVDSERVLAVDDFVLGKGVTARREDELLIAVILPARDRDSGAYVRFSRVDGDYPVVTAAVRLGWSDGAIASASISIGGCGPVAYRVPASEGLLRGVAAMDDIPGEFFDSYVAAARPPSDLKGSAEYRLMLIPGLLRRALDRAIADRPDAA